MVNARNSHGNVHDIFLSPEGSRKLAGGNTAGNRLVALRPGGSPESSAGYSISPINPICPIIPSGHHVCKPLIKVDPSLSRTHHKPLSGQKIRGSNQNQTVTDQKNYYQSLRLTAARKDTLRKLTQLHANLRNTPTPPYFSSGARNPKNRNTYSSRFFGSRRFKPIQGNSSLFKRFYLHHFFIFMRYCAFCHSLPACPIPSFFLRLALRKGPLIIREIPEPLV
jgi:hypothetical protein